MTTSPKLGLKLQRLFGKAEGAEVKTILNLVDELGVSEETLNLLAELTAEAAELNVLDGATAGAIVASKGIVNDANGTITGLKNVLRDTADGTIAARRLVEIDASGDLVEGTAGSLTVVGVEADNDAKASTDDINVMAGYSTVVTAGPVVAGTAIKCADNGRVIGHLNSAAAGGTMLTTAAGSAFTNQPANDSVTLASAESGDTNTVTIIGTTNGGVVVVTEDVVLTGDTPVESVKSDWGVILAVKIAGTTAGTVTLTETSGGQTIVAITAGANKTAGVNSVAAADQSAFGAIPTLEGSDTTTKVVGVKYQKASDGSDAYAAIALVNTTATAVGATAMNVVSEVYTGDLEGTRTAVLKVRATEDDENVKVGKAVGGATAVDTSISAYISP